jgi:LDH2 family malate/lactate/ureidoglycolate dehydrogenase
MTADQFRAISTRLYKAAGASDEDAKYVTESILTATLRGHESHGVGQLARYLREYVNGLIEKDGSIKIINETPATVAIDGDWCLGQKVAMVATDKVIEKAKLTGIAAATIQRTCHVGTLFDYNYKIAQNDMIGMMFTNAGASSPPWGGVQRMLGTNPLGYGIPAKEEYPIIADVATSSTSHGGLREMMVSGKPLPPGLLLDDEGELTSDRSKFTQGGGEVHGSMANMANNHKGYAIQLAVEMLGGIFGGLTTGNEMSKGRPGIIHNPSLFIAINVSFFQDLEAFKRKVDERIREIHASRRKTGVEAIYLPGEQGFKTAEQRLRGGIPLHEEYWKQIEEQAEQLKVDLTDLLGAPA